MCQVRKMCDRSSWENASGRVVLKRKGGFPCEDGEKQYCRFIADKSARLYVIIGVCWISLICYVNCLSAAGVHGVHSELSDEKGYGQCRETEHVQWEVLPLYIPQTKYPLKHRRTQTLYPEHSSIYRRITERSFFMPSTCHVVMHPVQHDLWGTVPAGRHVAGHLIVGVSCQTKVQNLTTI